MGSGLAGIGELNYQELILFHITEYCMNESSGLESG